ncbi:uncharacterized protein LOC129921457 isoform X2 [Episyrphus balteatus]|uniref:uncharacterized protein LOC129921457 isoform X2 n=1 Tax=Episyrphus balteatus TaxID=286459 RepID=UPI0024852A01|nr:uncharacterized protein LOC129921457 isoform X2 [Episyrphus balteatus]
MSSSAMYAGNRSQQTWSNPHQLRKQRSFVESTHNNSESNRSSARGRSANRSGSVILARLPSERNKFLYLQKQRSVVDQVCAGIRGRSEQRSKKYTYSGTGDKGSWSSLVAGKDAGVHGAPKLAWTNNTFDCDRLIESGTFLSNNFKKDVTSSQHLISDRNKKSTSSGLSKSENKINLSINLTQTIKSVDNDSFNSDIDSSSECTDYLKTTPHHSDNKKPSVDNNKSTVQSECRITSAAQRRAQFQSTKGDQFCTSNSIQTVPSPNTVTLSASPSLTIQKRPPLVRAMSAPVRSIADSTKNLLANTKRKTRRRRILPRNSSCDKEGETIAEVSTIGQTGKKLFSRSRSTIASDVITLVSLASSEGSESEKEDSGSTDECQTARAPSLRKTGKSVSFQENEQPTFQMAVKEFPHMLRRGSIAPLAARLRANRPPTAPPGSIFRSDFENCTIKMSQLTKATNKDDLSNAEDRKENNIFNNNGPSSAPESPVDFEFPDHVRSTKERECWKLFQKMSKKGVSVKYDTILRGMLTPTEFRQLQKQRDIENAKHQETEENNESTTTTAIHAENKILNKNIIN